MVKESPTQARVLRFNLSLAALTQKINEIDDKAVVWVSNKDHNGPFFMVKVVDP